VHQRKGGGVGGKTSGLSQMIRRGDVKKEEWLKHKWTGGLGLEARNKEGNYEGKEGTKTEEHNGEWQKRSYTIKKESEKIKGKSRGGVQKKK